MMSLLIRVTFAILVINQLLTPCSALKSFRGGYNSGKSSNQPKGSPKTYLGGTSSGLPSQNSTRRGLGMSAWGIVALIISMILAGMGFYYFSMCYPILCKKERKYDMIGLASVA